MPIADIQEPAIIALNVSIHLKLNGKTWGPFFAFILWLFFGNKNLNYAEVLILFVYTLAFAFLLIIPVTMLNLFINWKWISFLSIPVMAIYITWTNLNFINTQRSWIVVIKSIFMLLIGWFA